jgi:phosphoglycerate dehydrogenase-like enzyme
VLGDPKVGNNGKTVGIVGHSRIGARVIELLQPFDLEVVLYDPHYTSASQRVRNVELDQLMAEADIVSLHAPAIESTARMIDARRLALMPDGATLINTARGALVDQDALLRELVSGRISAVIDVTTPEVLPADSPLYDLPNVLLTPHIAGALGNERSRLGATVVAEIERFIAGEPLSHGVAAETLHLQA